MGRMAHYARLIAIQLAERHGLDDEFINHILLFAPLHDIGKIGVPDHILLKPGTLTAEEFAVMQTHVCKGVDIIDTLSGYPYGMQGDAIPLESRIATVADVFDALISERPYHHGRPIEAAF